MKKIITPTIALIIGLVVGYLVCKNQHRPSLEMAKMKADLPVPDTSRSLVESNKLAFAAIPPTEVLDHTLIKKMVDGFRAQNNSGVLVGSDGKPLKGYFVEAKDLKEILNDPKNFDGVSFYLGKHPDHLDPLEKVYTLLFMGANITGRTTVNGITKIQYKDDETHIYDHVSICPDECGTF